MKIENTIERIAVLEYKKYHVIAKTNCYSVYCSECQSPYSRIHFYLEGMIKLLLFTWENRVHIEHFVENSRLKLLSHLFFSKRLIWLTD